MFCTWSARICVQNFAIVLHRVSAEISPRQNQRTLKYLVDITAAYGWVFSLVFSFFYPVAGFWMSMRSLLAEQRCWRREQKSQFSVDWRLTAGGVADFTYMSWAYCSKNPWRAHASRRGHWSFVWDHVSLPYTKTGRKYICCNLRMQPDAGLPDFYFQQICGLRVSYDDRIRCRISTGISSDLLQLKLRLLFVV